MILSVHFVSSPVSNSHMYIEFTSDINYSICNLFLHFHIDLAIYNANRYFKRSFYEDLVHIACNHIQPSIQAAFSTKVVQYQGYMH